MTLNNWMMNKSYQSKKFLFFFSKSIKEMLKVLSCWQRHEFCCFLSRGSWGSLEFFIYADNNCKNKMFIRFPLRKDLFFNIMKYLYYTINTNRVNKEKAKKKKGKKK